jgi:hypothetical protein
MSASTLRSAFVSVALFAHGIVAGGYLIEALLLSGIENAANALALFCLIASKRGRASACMD